MTQKEKQIRIQNYLNQWKKKQERKPRARLSKEELKRRARERAKAYYYQKKQDPEWYQAFKEKVSKYRTSEQGREARRKYRRLQREKKALEYN